MAFLNRPFSISTQTCLILLFVAALWLGGLHWFTRGIDAAASGNTHAPADAIVALTGGTNRLQTAFDLLDNDLGKKLFISGVYHGVEVRELLALWKEEQDAYPEGTVVLGFDADDTVGNARETVDWLRKEGYKTFYLVTANYHLKRAAMEFRLIAPDLQALPYPVTPEGLDMRNWWRNKTHRSLIIGEYMKYLFSLLRYAITVRPA
jgi:uncharacterized SAM-binding protein YcdF (DUF218 family)